jgi:hypothetical protein
MTCIAFFLAAATLIQSEPSEAPRRAQSASQDLRSELCSNLAGMASPAKYELEYSNYSLQADSPIGREFLDVLLGVALLDSTSFVDYCELLSETAKGPNARADGILMSTGVQTFHVEASHERVAQWCTSDSRFPATLRTRELEIAYFSEFRRLDFQVHTPGLNLFEPCHLITPFPNSPSQLEFLRKSNWTEPTGSVPVRRVTVARKNESVAWLAFDLGPAPASLPYACIMFRAGQGSRHGFASIVRWSSGPAEQYWDGILYVTDLGNEIEISVHERKDVRHDVRDADVRLPVGPPASIRDRTAGTARAIPTLEGVPESWRSCIQVQLSASSGSNGNAK